MLRFSVLSLTTVAALTPRNHDVTICDENVQPLDFDTPCDVVGVTFMTALAPGHTKSPPSSAAAAKRSLPEAFSLLFALKR